MCYLRIKRGLRLRAFKIPDPAFAWMCRVSTIIDGGAAIIDQVTKANADWLILNFGGGDSVVEERRRKIKDVEKARSRSPLLILSTVLGLVVAIAAVTTLTFVPDPAKAWFDAILLIAIEGLLLGLSALGFLIYVFLFASSQTQWAEIVLEVGGWIATIPSILHLGIPIVAATWEASSGVTLLLLGPVLMADGFCPMIHSITTMIWAINEARYL